MEYPTIDACRIDTFPWKEGEKVIIKWPNREPEPATIAGIHSSRQWGKDTVHGVTVTTEESDTPFAVNHLLFETQHDKLL